MLFRRTPQMSIAPSTQPPEFLDLGMFVLHVVFYGETCGIENADVGAKTVEDA